MIQEIMEKYADMLYRLAYLRLQNCQDAEDVVQETFYRYIKREEGFEDDEHEKAWLITVTINGCRRIWRSAWKRHSGELDEVLWGQQTAPQEAEPENRMVEKESAAKILEAVMSLPVHYRDVIHLFYYEEMSVREIALATGRKEATITSQLTRGRDLLRKKLKEDYDFA